MIISIKRILELNEQYHFVSGFSGIDNKIEGVGLDVRAGEIYKISGRPFLGETGRITPKTELLGSFTKGPYEVTLSPSDYVLVKTMERVQIPPYKVKVRPFGEPSLIMLDVYPRSTLQRCGIYLMATKTDPGYEGELVFGMANVGGQYFTLEMGSRIANIVFEEVYGDLIKPYEGKWKGGRVGTEGKKEQW